MPGVDPRSRRAHVTTRRLVELAMPCRTRIPWDLPAGLHVVVAMDEDAHALSAEEEAGIELALESYRQGRAIHAERAREIIDAAFRR